MARSMVLVIWAAGIGLALFALDRVLLLMERKGWIYYRKKKPNPASVGSALLELQNLVEPSRKYVLDIRKEEKKEQADQGDPPKPGA